MMEQLYENIKGGGYNLLISWKRYRRVMYDLKTENVYLNPLLHLIKGEFTFIHNDKTILLTIGVKNGRGTFIVKEDGIVIMSRRLVRSLYTLHQIQIEYWNTFGVPLVHHLIMLGLLSDENLCDYCSVLFYPPILSGRTEWDVMEVRPDYYIHKMGDEWCLYYWVSGQDEICMDLYVDDGDIDMVMDKFRTILDEMGVEPPDKTTNWSDVTYNEDGTFTLSKCVVDHD